MTTARERAEAAQLEASDPRASVFVAASAGSGKTKLLTDRLLRLMLGGAEPGRIQCLTFTKAAAAEMSLRLQKRLGAWVTLPDAELDEELAGLDVEPSTASRRKARGLFADVLDQPGGMRIGTIHAFCQSLLRRFPLEAQLSPHFQLIEDVDARAARDEAREEMLAHAPPGLARELAIIAGLVGVGTFGALVGTLGSARARLARAIGLNAADLHAAARRAVGIEVADDATVVARGVVWLEEPVLRDAATALAAGGSPTVREKAARMLEWLGLDAATRAEHWDAWTCLFFTEAPVRRGMNAMVNQKLAGARPDLVAAVSAEQDRIEAIEDDRRALRCAEISAALLRLAAPVLDGFAARKERGGLLDYDDLIARSSALLVDPGAAWVLYKLDGGLDHLLLDEVQDTSGEQWKIAEAVTDEFFAGAGARDVARTFFAVGDPKQSIYSFQGADPQHFEGSRDRFRGKVRDAGETWRDVALDVSFRSAAPVLALVDAVFADPVAAAGVVPAGEVLHHYPNRAGAAGRVEIWPLAPSDPAPETEPWTVPERNLALTSAPQRLADGLAEWIATQTRGDMLLESQGRRLVPGDVLVLLRRRNQFATALVRALKARGVPVAGLDRMVLTEQAAVQDLMALCDALLLPQDDLTLACVLTSPLGFLSDDSLMQLAIGRTGTLWAALRARHAERAEWGRAWAFLSELQARVDYVTPHALLAEVLGPLGGRARLFARLGPEAAEPVDEMLGAALAYTRAHPPSLQGFLDWLRRAASELKREPEGAASTGGGAVRIMTVHGAKGLQAPLVILPDTTALPPDDDTLTWMCDPRTGIELPLWTPRKELRCRGVSTAREAMRRQVMEEYNRLLYVALTRAEDRLLICGWQGERDAPDVCWYQAVLRGFDRLPAERHDFSGGWQGEVRVHASAQTAPVKQAARPPGAAVAALPVWIGRAPDWTPLPPPPEPARPRPLTPSRPEGVEFGPLPPAISPLAARQAAGLRFRRGELVHALLQHLPGLPADRREAAARAWVARPGHGLAREEAAALAEDALSVLAHPELAALMGETARAEVPLAGLVGAQVVSGRVDRLAVLPDRVLVADYKTGRQPPAAPERTPPAYVRQMSAYRALLRTIYPDRPVTCLLVWTHGPQVHRLPDALLDQHAPGGDLQDAQVGDEMPDEVDA